MSCFVVGEDGRVLNFFDGELSGAAGGFDIEGERGSEFRGDPVGEDSGQGGSMSFRHLVFGSDGFLKLRFAESAFDAVFESAADFADADSVGFHGLAALRLSDGVDHDFRDVGRFGLVARIDFFQETGLIDVGEDGFEPAHEPIDSLVAIEGRSQGHEQGLAGFGVESAEEFITERFWQFVPRHGMDGFFESFGEIASDGTEWGGVEFVDAECFASTLVL